MNLDPALLSWLSYSPTLKQEKSKSTAAKLTPRSSTTDIFTEISIGSTEIKAKRGNETNAPSVVNAASSIGPVKSGSKLRLELNRHNTNRIRQKHRPESKEN